MLLTLGLMTLLGLGSMLAIDRTVGEIKSAGNQLRDKRGFFRAEGGAAICLRELRNRLQTALPAQLAALPSIDAVTSYATGNDPAGFLAQYAYQPGSSFGGAFIRDSATRARLPLTYTASAASGPYACTLTVDSRDVPETRKAGDSIQHLFRYNYAIDGTATDEDVTRRVGLQGSFSVLVQYDNFARYALFTNQQMSGRSRIWFTNQTTFSGPVHTNGEFNFFGNPGAAFTGRVTSVSTTARYYNNGVNLSLDADRNGNVDVPAFGGGFSRGVANIPMPATTTADRQREAALGGTSTPELAGVYLGTAGGVMTGGIYVKGNATISLGVAGPGVARYTIAQNGTTWTVTVNYVSSQTTLQQGSGSAMTYGGLPNGMLYVDGVVNGLAGTVQRDTELTIAATSDIMVTDHIMYENYTPGPSPSAEGAANVLGLLSWRGNVRIPTTAPNDITIHATVMTPTGEFKVDSYSTGSSRGTATILGGVIENTYGPFGTLSSSGSLTGYQRNFIYDSRMGQGKSPPFFPTIGKVVSTVSGVDDRPNWQQTN